MQSSSGEIELDVVRLESAKMPIEAGIRVQLRPQKWGFYREFWGWEARKLNCINRVYGAGDGNRTHRHISFYQSNHADSAALTHLTYPDFRSSEPSFAPKLRPTFSLETLSV
jgi:hypothetical protein